MKGIHPFLWFDDQAEEAAKFYTSIFKDSRITKTLRYPAAAEDVARKPRGSVMTVAFELDGQQFVALNGGPEFNFSPAISFVANCETQEEIDELSEKLSEGGELLECGWLRDKFGVSWQIVPAALPELLSAPEKAEGVMGALLQMKKIEMDRLAAAS